MSMALPAAATPMAFGVDPTRRELYSLRQARYQEIGEQVARLAAQRTTKLKLLDVGVWNGVSMRYIERQPGAEKIEFHGIDLELHNTIYNRDKWAGLQQGDLLEGVLHVPSNQFDVVICEQVLEHCRDWNGRDVVPGETGRDVDHQCRFPPGVPAAQHLVPLAPHHRDEEGPRPSASVSLGSFVRELKARCSTTSTCSRPADSARFPAACCGVEAVAGGGNSAASRKDRPGAVLRDSGCGGEEGEAEG
jgi:hypothetical protein